MSFKMSQSANKGKSESLAIIMQRIGIMGEVSAEKGEDSAFARRHDNQD